MAENVEQSPATVAPAEVPSVRNLGEPLRFEDVEPIAGVTAEPAKGGQHVKVWTRLALSWDEPLFYLMVENLDGVIRHMAQKAASAVNLRRANTVLLILKPDNSAELWVDAAAVSLQ